MKRFLSIACVLVLALTCGLVANAKKKEVCFQMYSVRDLIGNPEKYAQNHEKTLKATFASLLEPKRSRSLA